MSTLAEQSETASAVTFEDEGLSAEFTDEIRWMGAQAISTGYPVDGGREYRPFGLVTRDAMAAFLYRYAGEPTFTAPTTPTFSDVSPSSSEFYKEIEWAAAEGVTRGYSDGTFKPTRPVTRDAMASFIYGLEGGSAPSGSAVYVDSSKSSEHKGAIEWLATQGVSQGWVTWRGREYRPFGNVTRDAMAAFLYRLEHGAEPVKAAEPLLEAQKDVWVTASSLNLRSQPTWDSSVVVTGAKHTRARYLGAREGGWIQVRMGGMIAWAPTAHLTTTAPSAAPTKVGLADSRVTFSERPNLSAPTVATVSQGTRGYFTGVSKGSWKWVSIAGTRGWTPASNLNTVKPYDADPIMSRAYSQVGYRGGNRTNKYSAWYGTTNPYCMVFVMWVFHHAGYPNGVPHRGLYSDWANVLQRSGVLDTNVSRSDLKRGHVALVDWPPHNGPTHTGIVSRVDGDYVWLVEGNTTDGTGDSSRGVFERRRAISNIHSVFDPDDYARSIGY
ncbi:S-layer homology domain-containing protein [Demequina sp. SO4-18]|uniref:S-layer homology domain-containing protein n=1 Tax=Demequina sp. SO4-18 TaxID=3401026 RepID=UPI003B59C374